MNEMTHRQYVELFHLLFIEQLGRQLDKQRYALKGGCNLRFFFRSLRYSEDIDVDVRTEPAHALRDKVRGILNGKPFRQILLARGMEIEHVTEAKQTETVQRWKLGLRAAPSELSFPTKIEFSRRTFDADLRFEGVDAQLIREYRLSPVLANHYGADTATRHKIEAVLSRRTPQARDIFDLHLLLMGGADIGRVRKEMTVHSEDLQARILAIGYDVFTSQVLAYLPPESQKQYASREVWERMVLAVATAVSEERP